MGVSSNSIGNFTILRGFLKMIFLLAVRRHLFNVFTISCKINNIALIFISDKFALLLFLLLPVIHYVYGSYLSFDDDNQQDRYFKKHSFIERPSKRCTDKLKGYKQCLEGFPSLCIVLYRMERTCEKLKEVDGKQLKRFSKD